MAFRYSLLERVYGQRSVLRNFYLVPILVEDLDRQLLVHDVVLCEENVEPDTCGRGNRADGIRLKRGNQSRRQVLRRNGGRDLRANAVVETPFDYVRSGEIGKCETSVKRLRFKPRIALL